MKAPQILYLVPDLFGPPGGIARYCRLVCQALTETGFQLTVIALHDQSVDVRQAKTAFPTMRYSACGGDRVLFARRALLSRRLHPAVVIVGHPHFSHLGWLIARIARAKLVTFMYGVEVWEPLSRLRRAALKKSDQWIAISQFTAQRAALSNALVLNKIRILYNCLDPQFQQFEPLQPKKLDLSLLTVARLSLVEQYKGHDYVIRAMPVLLKSYPHLIYYIIGDGDARPGLEALAAREGVAHAVRFLGFVSEAEITRYYRDTSVFIMPSRGEGFGFVFIEAMAQGTPAIGGNMDATPEVIVDGETGYLVDPLSLEAIVEATSRLLADRALRERMGQAAQQHVQQKFGVEQFKRTLLAHLEELQVRPAARRP